MTRRWVCTACEHEHAVEPLRCVKCGGAEFTEIAVYGRRPWAIDVAAKLVERKR